MKKTRKDSFLGVHLDYHAKPEDGLVQGKGLREEDIRRICQLLKPDFIQIDCKGHPGWASYPTKIGNAMPEFEKDTLALDVDFLIGMHCPETILEVIVLRSAELVDITVCAVMVRDHQTVVGNDASGAAEFQRNDCVGNGCSWCIGIVDLSS